MGQGEAGAREAFFPLICDKQPVLQQRPLTACEDVALQRRCAEKAQEGGKLPALLALVAVSQLLSPCDVHGKDSGRPGKSRTEVIWSRECVVGRGWAM